MIITKLMGGLGNQMFQYAFARHLSLLNQSSLVLDLDFLNERPATEDYTFRTYELEIFSIQAELTDKYFKKSWFNKLKNKLANLKYIHEPGQFEPALLELKGNFYLNGFWQSESYFKDITAQLRKDFSFTTELSEANQSWSNQIKKTNSVSLHIRRGDYVHNKAAAAHHGVCTINYYLEAIEAIKKKIIDPTFFIFSDDIDWVKNNLLIDSSHHFITNNVGDQSFNDMRLMSHCKHHIIANSSFSWWGAWLNDDPNKMVFAPKNWFTTNNHKSLDLIPSAWIRL